MLGYLNKVKAVNALSFIIINKSQEKQTNVEFIVLIRIHYQPKLMRTHNRDTRPLTYSFIKNNTLTSGCSPEVKNVAKTITTLTIFTVNEGIYHKMQQYGSFNKFNSSWMTVNIMALCIMYQALAAQTIHVIRIKLLLVLVLSGYFLMKQNKDKIMPA